MLIGGLITSSCSTDSENNNPTSASNTPPVIRSISATPNAVGFGQYTDITCVATDANRDSLTYYWFAAFGKIYESGPIIEWHAPDIDGSYWVIVTVNDGLAIDTDSLEIIVLAQNEPPSHPWDPSPRDREVFVSRPVTLSWQCSDVDGDSISYDLYFGEENLTIYQRNLPNTNFVLDNLNSNGTYYWRVDAKDSHGNARTGNTWTFFTE